MCPQGFLSLANIGKRSEALADFSEKIALDLEVGLEVGLGRRDFFQSKSLNIKHCILQ